MYMNDFSVRVPEGTERGGYVELNHNTQYTLILRNNRSERCDAEVSIDGNPIGTFRIAGRNSLRLERPANDDGRFTFYRYGSREANGLPGVSMSKRGVVSVVFTPEKKVEYRPFYPVNEVKWGNTIRNNTSFSYTPSSTLTAGDDPPLASFYTASGNMRGLKSGITGLSGQSGQTFIDVERLCYNYKEQTTINLRLAAKRQDGGPRPLTAYSTPVPPPIM